MSFPDIPGITLHETLSTLAILVTADGTQRKETDLLRPQRLIREGWRQRVQIVRSDCHQRALAANG
jgi:hypothetical protein